MQAIDLTPKSTAALARTILRAAFPATKFSVTTSRGSMVSSIRITWTDGPTSSAVENMVGALEAGHFNGMTDGYDYNAQRFLIVNGQTYKAGCRYVFTERHISPALANRCIAQIATFWGGVDVVPVAVAAFQGFKLEPDLSTIRADLDGDRDCWYASIRRAASNRAEFARADV